MFGVHTKVLKTFGRKKEKTLTHKKLTTMISIISNKFIEQKITFCLIGAFALGFYGLPRHTIDIDFMVDIDHWDKISEIMSVAGYTCFQKTDAFAQFDSDYDIFGKVDLMFANSKTGREMLDRSAFLSAELIGDIYVIQPSDYIILKLLAIANDKERLLKDEFDISEFFKFNRKIGFSEKFEKLDTNRIYNFAEKFRQTDLIKKYLIKEL